MKVITSDKVVTSKKVSGSIQVFNFCFIDDIKDICTNKANDKSCYIMYTYNNKKKNFVLMHLPKKLETSQSISSYFVTINENNNNNNIKFYLRNITQVYIEFALILNPEFYIWLFSKFILQLSTLLGTIIKVMKLLYAKAITTGLLFIIRIIYKNPHYKEKLEITKST